MLSYLSTEKEQRRDEWILLSLTSFKFIFVGQKYFPGTAGKFGATTFCQLDFSQLHGALKSIINCCSPKIILCLETF